MKAAQRDGRGNSAQGECRGVQFEGESRQSRERDSSLAFPLSRRSSRRLVLPF
jgi:hypothetical protein